MTKVPVARSPYAQVYWCGGSDGYPVWGSGPRPDRWNGTVWGEEGAGALGHTKTYDTPGEALAALKRLAKVYGVKDVRPWSGKHTD